MLIRNIPVVPFIDFTLLPAEDLHWHCGPTLAVPLFCKACICRGRVGKGEAEAGIYLNLQKKKKDKRFSVTSINLLFVGKKLSSTLLLKY